VQLSKRNLEREGLATTRIDPRCSSWRAAAGPLAMLMYRATSSAASVSFGRAWASARISRSASSGRF